MTLFKENGEYSWRKIMTAQASICFTAAVIGNLISTGFDELPQSYLFIIGGVFVFYFGKRAFETLRLMRTTNNGNDPK